MDAQRNHADAAIRRLAARQHGVVGRRQLLDAAVPRHAIDNRVRNGRLEPLHRGVYRVGPLQDRLERETAAVLACGDGALLSHLSAGGLWQLMPSPGPGVPVEVSAPGGRPDHRSGVRVHRVGRIGADEATIVDGVPVTTPERTILDLAAVLAPGEIERVVALAERRKLLDSGRGAALVERYPGRAGTRALRALLSRAGGPALTRSEAEALLLDLVRRAKLPAPATNARLQGFEVDFLWRKTWLVIEVDGYAFHSSRPSFERDRRRDRVLTAAGFNVMRVTFRELTEEPEVVLAQVAQALVRGA